MSVSGMSFVPPDESRLEVDLGPAAVADEAMDNGEVALGCREDVRGGTGTICVPIKFDPAKVREVRKGMQDDADVRTLQESLNVWRARMGKPQLKVDGHFGPETLRAVAEFQRSVGLPPHGAGDRATWRELARVLPERGPVMEFHPATKFPSFDAESMPTIKSGSKDFKAVETLQNALNVWRESRGQEPIGVDKDFGPITRMALIDFQRLNGIPPTGVAGPDTWARLAQIETRDLTSARVPVETRTPWISQFDRDGRVERPGDTACYRACVAMLKEYMANTGTRATLLGADARIDVGTHETKTGNVIPRRKAVEAGRNYIDRSLDVGLPVLVGVSHQAGSTYNVNAVTDHYVLITGRGKDENGRDYYAYLDPSVGKADYGKGRFYVDDTGCLVKEGVVAKGLVADRRWEVSEIRTWKEIA